MKNALTNLTIGLTLISSSFCSMANSVWEVKKGDDSVYVGGTIHLLPVSEFPLPEAFTDTYAKVDEIVLEAELPDPTDQSSRMASLTAMRYGEGVAITDFISPELKAELDSYFDSVGVDFDSLTGFKPGFIGTVIFSIEANKAGMAGQGVDAYFKQLAEKDDKTIQFLETFESQLEMLAQLGVGDEESALSSQVKGVHDMVPTFQKIIKAWRQGDSDTIETLAVLPLKEQYPNTHHVLLPARNHRWVPQIEAMFNDEDKEFVLVGAAHLIGEGSVLELLESKGYEVNKL